MSGIPPPLARLTLLGKQADTFGNPLSGTPMLHDIYGCYAAPDRSL
ncbi:MAG: hypothetical protein IKI77_11080 [Oscillospiraceae bacterium]|nr:hypothetical protein [Oscillospiraceae bacterium]